MEREAGTDDAPDDDAPEDIAISARAHEDLWNRIHTVSPLHDPELRVSPTARRTRGVGFDILAGDFLDALAVLDFRAGAKMVRFEVDQSFLRVSLARKTGGLTRVRAPLVRGPDREAIAFEFPTENLRGWSRPVRGKLFDRGATLYCRLMARRGVLVIATDLRRVERAPGPARHQRAGHARRGATLMQWSVTLGNPGHPLPWDDAQEGGEIVPNAVLERAIAYAEPVVPLDERREQFAQVQVAAGAAMACGEDQSMRIHAAHADLGALSLRVGRGDCSALRRALRVAKPGHTRLYHVPGYHVLYDGVLLCAVRDSGATFPVPTRLLNLPLRCEIVVPRDHPPSAPYRAEGVAQAFAAHFAGAGETAPTPGTGADSALGLQAAARQARIVTVEAYDRFRSWEAGGRSPDGGKPPVVALTIRSRGAAGSLEIAAAQLEFTYETSVSGVRPVVSEAASPVGVVEDGERLGAAVDTGDAMGPVLEWTAHAYCDALDTIATELDGEAVAVGFGDGFTALRTEREGFTVHGWLIDPLAAAQRAARRALPA